MNPLELEQVGRYPVIRFIAEGGMSWVFEVDDPQLGVRRALKMLKPGVSVGTQHQRFSNEAGLLARIEHPNLIRVYDFALDPETQCHYYTMRLVDGPLLIDTQLDYDEAISVFEGILTGLSVLHDAGIVHRDLKPGNILLTNEGRPVLIDLGIAKQKDGANLTQLGKAIGTMLYMPPEQAQGKIAGPRSDVFAAGLTFYRLLTGESVYDAIEGVDPSSNESIVYHLAERKNAGGELGIQFPSEISEPIASLIRKACRFDPDERFADAHEMLRALRVAHAGVDPEFETSPLSTSAASSRKIRPWHVVIGVACIVAILAPIPVVLDNLARESLTEALTESATLAAEAELLIRDAEDLDPSPDPELIDGLRADLSTGARLRDRSQTGFDAGEYEESMTRAGLAIEIFSGACQKLIDNDLGSRAKAAHARWQQQVEDPGKVSASEIRPERFAELSSMIASLKSANTDQPPCETGHTILQILTAANQRQSAGGLFDATREISVAVRELDVKVAGDTVSANFEHRVTSQGPVRLDGKAYELKAINPSRVESRESRVERRTDG